MAGVRLGPSTGTPRANRRGRLWVAATQGGNVESGDAHGAGMYTGFKLFYEGRPMLKPAGALKLRPAPSHLR